MTIRIVENKGLNIIEQFEDLQFDPFLGVDEIQISYDSHTPKYYSDMKKEFGRIYADHQMKEREIKVRKYKNQSLIVIDKKVYLEVYGAKRQITIEYYVEKK